MTRWTPGPACITVRTPMERYLVFAALVFGGCASTPKWPTVHPPTQPDHEQTLQGMIDGKAAVDRRTAVGAGASAALVTGTAPLWLDRDRPLTQSQVTDKVVMSTLFVGAGGALLAAVSPVAPNKSIMSKLAGQPDSYVYAFRQSYESEYRKQVLYGHVAGILAGTLVAWFIYDGRIER